MPAGAAVPIQQPVRPFCNRPARLRNREATRCRRPRRRPTRSPRTVWQPTRPIRWQHGPTTATVRPTRCLRSSRPSSGAIRPQRPYSAGNRCSYRPARCRRPSGSRSPTTLCSRASSCCSQGPMPRCSTATSATSARSSATSPASGPAESASRRIRAAADSPGS